jgi:hypothetical protein
MNTQIKTESVGCAGFYDVERDTEFCTRCRTTRSLHWAPEGRVVTIRVESMARAQTILAQHNARVAKLNKRYGQQIEAAVLKTVRTREVSNTGPGGVEVKGIVADLDVIAPRAIIAGWEICATLANTDAGYLASRVVNATIADVAPFAARGGECDHCKAKRRRNTTYVVRRVEGEREIKVVGSNCVSDFTGHKNPASLISYADALSGFDDELEMLEDEGRKGGGLQAGAAKAVPLVRFLTFVRAYIRQDGWLSRGQARDSGRGHRATADKAWEDLQAYLMIEMLADTDVPERDGETGDWNPEFKKARDAIKPTAADATDAAADLALVEETYAALTVFDDFQSNLSVVLNQGFAFGRNIGLAAAICRAADKLRGEVAKKKMMADRVNEHVGTVAKREVFTLKIVHTQYCTSDWGATYLHIAVDAGNRTIKWFNKTSLDKGATYDVKGTVKKHEEYQGKKETVLTRVNVVKKHDGEKAA